MRVELNEVTLSIEKVLEEVPLDLTLRSQSLHVLVNIAGLVSLHVNLGEHWEAGGVVGIDPLLDLCLRPGLLSAELIAGAGEDLKSTATMSFVHFFVLPVVAVGDTSLRGYVNDNDGLCTLT